jgi:TonB family protein
MMKTYTIAFLLTLVVVQAAAVSDNDLQDLLKKQYTKQVLALRSPFQKGDQEFDSDGKPLNTASAGEWAFYGAIQVKKLNLRPDKLSLEGPWVAFGSYQKDQIPSNPIPLGKSIKVEIHLDHALASVQEAEAMLNRVFFLGQDASQHWLPEYRRSGALDEPLLKDFRNKGKDNVNPPIAIYTPDPDYSDEARAAKYQGNVVLRMIIDKAGRVWSVRVHRALGMGLDERAMVAVSNWRFQPATRDGQPMAAELTVEVSFRLY